MALAPAGQSNGTPAGAADRAALCRRLEGGLASKHSHTVFVDSGQHRSCATTDLLGLLAQHVQQNMVKIGKKFYRQREGIPQGSVLSPLLCSYFYADLERTRLGFAIHAPGPSSDHPDVRPPCLLLRLLDDWLLISTERAHAERFVRVMQAGVPEYGVTVNPAKTLVNFDLDLGGSPVARAQDPTAFPFCGVVIDCSSLDIRKDTGKLLRNAVFDSLTVDLSRRAGQNFLRKVVRAFRIQSHRMFFDTTHNSARAVVSNMSAVFAETARKMWAYARCFPARHRPGNKLLIKAISKVISAAMTILVEPTRCPGYVCSVGKPQIRRLACAAFRHVLADKQAGYAGTMQWLSAAERC